MRRALSLFTAVLLLAGCATVLLAGCATGTDAVARGGTFEFVSPGGRTDIFYDPPTIRGTVGELSGDSLTEPGTTVSLARYPNEVVVLNIWGSWCGPCRSEAAELVRVAHATASRGVRFVGIDVRDDRAAGADFARDFGLTYPSIFDPPGRTLFALSGIPRSVVPLTVVLDRHHRVAAVFLHAMHAQDLQPAVQRIATER
ncbi:MAG: TlpA family protein disulfide reductase [Pseudonocardiales bacterium]|nr:TlpA family protein disulfide reductase [Pseudonocardiales bacterium]MBV9031949.1 TlpA family protein disulfide reductase [Pseudonocardiales bacterium]MBW0009331.1 TlpA family protein disulfide reductase [Pseudonocardiales bacterium]